MILDMVSCRMRLSGPDKLRGWLVFLDLSLAMQVTLRYSSAPNATFPRTHTYEAAARVFGVKDMGGTMRRKV